MKIVHDIGKEIEIGEAGETRLRYAYGPTLAPKPFLHPLAIPGGGAFTAYRPADHMWHRGLWFAWKFVNEANYWEEGVEIEGTQETVGTPDVAVEGDGTTFTVTTDLSWHDRGRTRLQEHRRLRYTPGRRYSFLDWETRQTPLEDLTLDRTPFTTWGGYGGLVIRAAQSLRNPTLLFPDGEKQTFVAGVPHRWGDLSGQMDGAPDRFGGIAFFDHPDNPRHPTPFYARSRPLDNFMNAAILFHEPFRLREGDALRLRYRVVLHRDAGDADALNALWDAYSKLTF